MSGHGPIEPAVKVAMNGIAEVIHGALPTGWGFALLVFEFGDREDNRMNYISNASREDMLAAMKEFIANAEGRVVPGGRA